MEVKLVRETLTKAHYAHYCCNTSIPFKRVSLHCWGAAYLKANPYKRRVAKDLGEPGGHLPHDSSHMAFGECIVDRVGGFSFGSRILSGELGEELLDNLRRYFRSPDNFAVYLERRKS